jgi:hypothetical protein
MTRDYLDLAATTDPDALALKILSDRVQFPHDRELLLATAALIQNLRHANFHLRRGIEYSISDAPKTEPCSWGSMDGDDSVRTFYDKREWQNAEKLRAVLKSVGDIK